MGKQIYLSGVKKKQLEKDFKVSRQTVWSALNFQTMEGKSNLLRAAALQRGGVLLNYNGDFEPNLFFIVHYNEVPHQFICTFSSRVRLVCELSGDNSGDAYIEADGEVVKTYTKPLVSEIVIMQAAAQEIDNDLK